MATANTRSEAAPVAGLTDRAPRDRAIDAVRGLAIFGVVYIHAAWLLGVPLVPTSCFRWAVPAFITITSFLAVRPTKRPYGSELRTRLLRLFVPYAFWSAVYVLVIPGLWDQNVLRTVAMNVLGYGWPGQYFFILLFQLTPLLPFLTAIQWRLTAVVTTVLTVSIIAFVFGEFVPRGTALSPLGDRPFVFWLGFCVSGIWIAQNAWRLHRGRLVPAWLIMAGFLAAVAAIMFELHWLDGHRPGRPNGYLATTVQALSPIIFLLLWFLFQQQQWASAILAYVGRWSLGIFCLNPLVIMVLEKVLKAFSVSAVPFVPRAGEPFLLALAVLMASLALSAAISKLGGRVLVR